MPYLTSRTLRFGHCDPAGIAYFPSYFDILCDVVEEFSGVIGVPWVALFGEQRRGMPTARLEVDFIAPGRHGDQLDFAIHVRAVGRASADLEHRVTCGGRLLWTCRQVLVFISLDSQRATSWPDDTRQALLSRLEESDAPSPAT